MAKIELKPLQGLKGLSDDELKEWYAKYPKSQGRTFEQNDRVYRNQQFVNRYGIEMFNSMPDPIERDKIYFEDVVSNIFTDTFYKEDDFEELNKLTPQGKFDLLEQYQPTSEYEEYKKRELEKSKEYDNSFVGRLNRALGQGDTGVQVGLSQEENLLKIFEASDKRRQNLKEDIIAKDLERVLNSEEIQKRASEITSSWDETLKNGDFVEREELEKQFDEILTGEFLKPQYDSGLGNSNVPSYYKAFKNSKYFEDFSFEEKKQKAAEFLAAAEATDENTAFTALNNHFQNYIHDKQGWWTRRGLSAMNIGTGAVKECATLFTAMGVGVVTAAYGREGLANYLNGLDPKTGEPLPFFLSPKYWEGVDRYNTFMPETIQKAEDAGGISEWNPVYSVGTSMSGEQMFDEALKMNKFILSFLLMGGVESLGTKFLAKSLGGTFLKTIPRQVAKEAIQQGEKKVATEAAEWYMRNAILDVSKAPAWARYINAAGAYAQLATPAVSIGYDYAYMGYENALDTFGQQINEVIAKDSGIKSKELQASPDFQLELDNRTNQILKETFESFSDDEIIRILENMYGHEDDPRKNMEKFRSMVYLSEQTNLTNALLETIFPEIANSPKIKELKKKAINQAVVTFQVDAAIETISQLGATKMFRGFLFNQGTKAVLNSNNPFLRDVTVAGDKLVLNQQSRAWRTAYEVAKPVLGGAGSNYMDDIRLEFATGYGMYGFNNLLNKYYDPDSYIETGNILTDYVFNPLLLANEKGQAALTDRQSLRDALIGGLGTISTFGLGRGGYGRSNRIQGKNKFDTFAKNFNRYINNPLFEAYNTAEENATGAQELVDMTNKEVNEHLSELDEISKFVAGEKIAIQAEQEGSMIKAKDAKASKAFELGMLLHNLSTGELTSQHPIVQKQLQLINDIVNDNLSEEQLNQLVNDFVNQPQNKSLKEQANSKQIAIELLKENAQRILDVTESIEKVDSAIKKSKLSGKISKDTYSQLIYMQYMKQNWEERLNQINQELFPLKRDFLDMSNVSRYGSRKGWQKEHDSYQETINSLKEKIEKISVELGNLLNKKDFEKSKTRKRVYDRQISAKKLQEEAMRETLEQLETEFKQLKEAGKYFKENQYAPTLSKSDILGLDAVTRVKMLDNENLSNYSKEQQRIIKETITDLLNKDIDAIEKVSDAAALQYRIEQTNNSYAKILKNPEAFSEYENVLKESRGELVFRKLVEEAQQRKFDALLNAILSRATQGSSEFNNLAKNSHSSLLKAFVNKYKEYSDLLQPIIDRNITIEGLNQTVDNLDVSDNQKLVLKKNLHTLTKDANTSQEVIDSIENFIDNSDTTDEGISAREQMNEILDKAKDFDIVRNATKVEQRGNQLEKDRKVRDAKNRRNQKAREKRAKVRAEKEAEKKKLEEKEKAKKAEEEKRKQEEEAKNKAKGMNGKLEDTQQSIDFEDTSFEGADGEMIELEGIPKYDPKQSQVNTTEDATTETEDTVTSETITTDDNKNTIPPSDSNSPANQLRGNTLTPYSVDALEDATLKDRTQSVNSWLAAFFKWMDNAGIKFQEIIDYELSEIAKLNPTVHYMMTVVPDAKNDATNDRVLVRTPLLVVEATDTIKKLHKEERGGIIKANGKEWLVIGMLGYQGEQGVKTPENVLWDDTVNKLAARRDVYFKNNPTERFEVDEKFTTSIKAIAFGRLIKSIEGEPITDHTISELLNDPKRNPYGLKWEDLAFAIQMASGGFDTSRKLDGTVISPHDAAGNAGNVFVMVKGPRGDYMPVAIKPAFLSEIKPGALMDTIDRLFNGLINPDHKVRWEAITQLSMLLHLDNSNNILIGTADNAVLTIVQNGVKPYTFNLSDENLNRVEVFQRLKEAHFRIQISKNDLKNIDRLKELDEAGALQTDAAMLALVGGHYTVNATDFKTGKPIEQNALSNSNGNTVKSSGLNSTKYPSQLLDGRRVNKIEGKWCDEFGNPITDSATIEKINYLNSIEENNIPIAYTNNKGYNVYIVQNSKENPVVVLVNQAHNVQITRGKDAANAIAYYENQQRTKALNVAKSEEIDLGLEETTIDTSTGQITVLTPTNVEENNLGQDSQEKVKNSIQPPKEKVKETKNFVEVNREKSSEDLHNSNNILTFAELATKNRNAMNTFRQIAKEKGWVLPSKFNEIDEFLKSKDISMPTDLSEASVNDWLDMVKNCK